MAALVVDSSIRMCGLCARVAQRQCYGQTVQNSVLVPQLQSIFGRRFPFVPQRQNLMVQTIQQTAEIFQLLFDFRWSMLPCRARVDNDSLRPWLVMLVTIHLIRVPFRLSQAPDAWHHGRYGPEEHVSSYLPQVQLLDEVVVPVVCNDICPGPAAHHSGGAAGAAHHQGHLHPRRGAEFDPHGSDCSADHRDSTVAVPRQGVDMPVVGPHRCNLCSSSSWCSTGAALGQGCRARCVHDKCPDPDAQYSGGAAVAVPLQGRHHPRRCAETGSHGLTVQQTTEILLLQYIDKVFDDPVVQVPAVSTGAVVEKTV